MSRRPLPQRDARASHELNNFKKHRCTKLVHAGKYIHTVFETCAMECLLYPCTRSSTMGQIQFIKMSVLRRWSSGLEFDQLMLLALKCLWSTVLQVCAMPSVIGALQSC